MERRKLREPFGARASSCRTRGTPAPPTEFQGEPPGPGPSSARGQGPPLGAQSAPKRPLAVRPNRLLTPDFKAKLCEFKPALLPLLRTKGVTWIKVYSFGRFCDRRTPGNL